MSLKATKQNAILDAFHQILERSHQFDAFEDYASDLNKYRRKMDMLSGQLSKIQHALANNFDNAAIASRKFLPLLIEATTEIDGHFRDEYGRNYPELLNLLSPRVVSVQNRSRKLLAYLDNLIDKPKTRDITIFSQGMERLLTDLTQMAEDFDAYAGYFSNIFREHQNKPEAKPPKSRKDLLALSVIISEIAKDVDEALYLPFQAEGNRLDPKQMQGAILGLVDDLAEELDPFADEDSKNYIDNPQIQNEIHNLLIATDELWAFIKKSYTQRSWTTVVRRDLLTPLQRLLTKIAI